MGYVYIAYGAWYEDKKIYSIMKKIIIALGIIVAVVLIYLFAFIYKVERVCFGDVCPQNGGLYLLYRQNYTKDQCLTRRAYPVHGYAFGPVYAGCTPLDRKLSR